MPNQLVRYDAMCRAIDACERVDEVVRIRDQAQQLQAAARVAQNHEAENKLRIIRVRAERHAGVLLQRMRETGERRPAHRTPANGGGSLTLESIGVSSAEASEWQRLAAIPEPEFEAALTEQERPSTRNIVQGRVVDTTRVRPGRVRGTLVARNPHHREPERVSENTTEVLVLNSALDHALPFLADLSSVPRDVVRELKNKLAVATRAVAAARSQIRSQTGE